MINLAEVGAHPRQGAAGIWDVKFGIYLPGITFNKGYRLKLRLIHELDQFIRVPPRCRGRGRAPGGEFDHFPEFYRHGCRSLDSISDTWTVDRTNRWGAAGPDDSAEQ